MSHLPRGPSNEPTLLMGDLELDIDCDVLDSIVFSVEPCPMRVRRSLTRHGDKRNVFYQYVDFADARVAWKTLSGRKVHGRHGVPDGFQLDFTFAAQKEEAHAFMRIDKVHLTRHELYRVLSRYTSVLGLAQYQFRQDETGRVSTSCFVRFGDPEDCMQAVTELHKMPVEGGRIATSFSVRHIDHLKAYVNRREAVRLLDGSPYFHHNFYEKRRLTLDELNSSIISSSGEFFDDFESSRWSNVVLRPNVDSMDYARQMTISFFEHF